METERSAAILKVEFCITALGFKEMLHFTEHSKHNSDNFNCCVFWNGAHNFQALNKVARR